MKTGAYYYDFDNTAGATEAYNAAKAAGVGAVYAYLAGALEPIVQLANADGIITMSAGSSTACERTDLTYNIAVKFDAGDYILEALDRIASTCADVLETLPTLGMCFVSAGASPARSVSVSLASCSRLQ